MGFDALCRRRVDEIYSLLHSFWMAQIVLGFSESSKTYLLGSIFSSLIGCVLVEKFNCGFLMPCAGGVDQLYSFLHRFWPIHSVLEHV